MIAFCASFWRDRRTVTSVEYGVIAGILAVVLVTAFTALGNGLNNAFISIVKQMGGAG